MLKNGILIVLVIIFLYPASGITADTVDSSVSSELLQGFKRLHAESVDLVTGPFQLEHNNIFITIGVLGATALTYSFDQEIQGKVHSNQNITLDNITNIGTVAGDPFFHLGLAAVVYGSGIAANSPKWKTTGEMMGEALILADASNFLIKEAAGRGRPSVSRQKGDLKPFSFQNNYDSFPSMHTASSFALASVLAASSENMALKISYYLAASFVGFSRMYKNKHWASDVLFGAAIGEFCGNIVTSYHASGRSVTFVPQAYESGAGLALVGTW